MSPPPISRLGRTWRVLVGVKVVGLTMGLAVGLANVLAVPVDLAEHSCWLPSRDF